MTQHAPFPPQQTVPRQGNGLGTAGFVVGLIGLLFSFIPVIGVIAWPLVILGIVFAAVGIAKSSGGRAGNRGLAVAGLVLSLVGLLICVLWAVAWDNAVDEVKEEAAREIVVVYEVSGTATGVDVTYTTFGDTLTTDQETAATLPWTKEVTTSGLLKGGSLMVMTAESGGEVTCTVTVDGEKTRTATASGPFAIATCDGF